MIFMLPMVEGGIKDLIALNESVELAHLTPALGHPII